LRIGRKGLFQGKEKYARGNSLYALLVGSGRRPMGRLIDLVTESVGGSGSTVSEGVLSGNVALGLLLVGFLGDGGGGFLDLLLDVVDGVTSRVGDLADDSLVWPVDVWGRHFDLFEVLYKKRLLEVFVCLVCRIFNCFDV